MLIFALDDEPLQLEVLEEAIREAEPAARLRSFCYAEAAIRAMREEGLRPDAVFSDIEMPGMSDMELARIVGKMSPRTNMIFVTGYSQYAPEAYGMWASGYVMKPVVADRIRAELDRLRFPVEKAPFCRIRAQCFGNFEVFSDGKPLKFRYAKSKEMLAYLIDRRGATLNTAQLCAVLWEDAQDSGKLRSLFRNVVADLTRTLRQNGGANVVRKGYNQFCVAEEALECDLYDFLRGSPDAARACTGEYMSQYSWAEAAMAALFRDEHPAE